MAKQHRSSKFILIVAGLIGTIGVPGVLLAQQPPPPDQAARVARPRQAAAPLRKLMAPFRGLQLTDDQRQQMRAVVEKHQADIRALAEKARAARQARRAATAAQPADQAAVQAADSQLAALGSERRTLLQSIQAEIAQVLTPEQKQKFDERMARRRQAVNRRKGA